MRRSFSCAAQKKVLVSAFFKGVPLWPTGAFEPRNLKFQDTKTFFSWSDHETTPSGLLSSWSLAKSEAAAAAKALVSLDFFVCSLLYLCLFNLFARLNFRLKVV